ncbi:ribokinase [Rossellomorea vietnamensis]|uniref:Ribokinase n=1 Tax=Rossellomorea vietnamensis TaxID=218284 RepID=A0A5D4NV68_9BACI|nr:ribokinase [Rossellomorea vietnamensis]TYS17769.1 ribokinase [Rossellomorea vietnamensis]
MITVIGSINMDLVTITGKDSAWGETVIGDRFHTSFGGKGANQAVAAARLGAKVQMIGAVGDDVYGKEYIKHLEKEGIRTELIKVINGEQTGIAAITVHDSENKIIVVPGANSHITPQVVEEHKETICKSEWLLLQLELPLESVKKAIDIAHSNGVKIILNPAPYSSIPWQWIKKVHYLTPNEIEADQLVQENAAHSDQLYQKLIITKGRDGVVLYLGEKKVEIPAKKVSAVDTTGAGDTFNGALAAELDEGSSLKEACIVACEAATKSVMVVGAQEGMPTREELLKQ